jgi:UPF0042 nucleotide-binding protein
MDGNERDKMLDVIHMEQIKLDQPDLIFVTGLSGAGRSSALKVFEDLGYAAIDNLPLPLVEGLLLNMGVDSLPLPMVVGVEFHTSQMGEEHFWDVVKQFQEFLNVRVIFLDCKDEELIRRYSITRRRHPLGGSTVKDAIQQERKNMQTLHEKADHIIDTSSMNILMFGRLVKNIFALRISPKLIVRLISFSYRHGLPQDADIVFDARFLSNPHYEDALQPLTGQDEPVGQFIQQDANWLPVFTSMRHMLGSVIEGMRHSGRSYITIAVGCTGGKHRSVFTAEQLAIYLKEKGEEVALEHRELEKEKKK